MKRVFVQFLTTNGLYTDGQSLTDREEAMMPLSQVRHYLEGAEKRGMSFDYKTGYIDVTDDDAEGYEFWGYRVISSPLSKEEGSN